MLNYWRGFVRQIRFYLAKQLQSVRINSAESNDTGLHRANLLLDTRRGGFCLCFSGLRTTERAGAGPVGAGSFHRALNPNEELIPFLASNPRCRAGARRHEEIFGHQRGGPVLDFATPALTIRRAEGIAGDSARSIPNRNISRNNGAMHCLQESFDPAG